ncbi:SMN [Lepeophtheirus salmonis]|uniref:SMN n=1 Tax=Lepeophtheirus salmonis TaxID=72036 RepID=A0A7R8D4X1_LEPSM|nr:SMN [Lepeophtheirus salmonis]CAF3027999.1 SMN [Lepeophtheirus salmonis]
MAEDSRVIFTKGDGDCEDNLWDDSLLIAAYDRATKKGDVVKRDWRLGENVRCDFEGVEYEAVIQCLDHGKGTATVRYIGYNNIEKVKIKELKLSLGQDQRDFSLLEAEGDEESSSLQKYEGESSWNVGDHCISIYKEDQRPYEAIITHMDSQSATVRFIGYDNIQSNNSLTELQPSNGETRDIFKLK